jgi:hypothetical protein
LRFPWPCSNVFIGTANRAETLPDALIDRMFLLAIRYPGDIDTNYSVTRVAYHEDYKTAEKYPIEDTHKKKPLGIRDVPMPVFVEKAIDALYMQLRNEYNPPGKKDILGSNRSKIDALDVARAKLLIDKVFYDKTPEIATSEYAIKGIQFAVCTLVATGTHQADKEFKMAFNKWAEENYPKLLASEENKFWCEFQHRLAIGMTQVPELEANYLTELKSYRENIVNAINAFGKIKYAYDNPIDKKAQIVKIENPFMDYLLNEQPRMRNFIGEPFKQLISYFLKSQETATASCKS